LSGNVQRLIVAVTSIVSERIRLLQEKEEVEAQKRWKLYGQKDRGLSRKFRLRIDYLLCGKGRDMDTLPTPGPETSSCHRLCYRSQCEGERARGVTGTGDNA